MIALALTGCGSNKGPNYPSHSQTQESMDAQKRAALVEKYGLEEWTLYDGTIITIEEFGNLIDTMDRAKTYRSLPNGTIIYAYQYPSFEEYFDAAYTEEEKKEYYKREQTFYSWNTARCEALNQLKAEKDN